MREVKSVHVLFNYIKNYEREKADDIINCIQGCTGMCDFHTVEEMCHLVDVSINLVDNLWVGMFDIIMNIHLIQKELDKDETGIGFDLADFIILHQFDIPIRILNRDTKYLLKDYISQYECAPRKIAENIENFDQYHIYFSKMSDEDKKIYSKMFIIYLNSNISLKRLLENTKNQFSSRWVKEIFLRIKKDTINNLDIAIDKESEKEALKHLILRDKYYKGENRSNIEKIKDMQEEMFRHVTISFPLGNAKQIKNPVIEIKTKPILNHKDPEE